MICTESQEKDIGSTALGPTMRRTKESETRSWLFFVMITNYAHRGMFAKYAVQVWAIPRSDLLSRKKYKKKVKIQRITKKRIFDMKNEFILIL